MTKEATKKETPMAEEAEIKMAKKKAGAFNFISGICAKISGTLEDHKAIQQALEILRPL